SQEPRLSLELNNVSVEQLLNTIEGTWDYLFVYRIKDVDLKRRVSIKVSDVPIETVLDQVFAGTRTDYEIVDRQIFLLDRRSGPRAGFKLTDISISPRLVLPAQIDTLLGIVRDEAGSPLVGVNVIIMGTNTG